MSKFKDFDEAFKEKTIEDIKFKVKGKKYKISGVMPAIIPVKFARLQEEYKKDENLPYEETFSIMLKIMEEEKLDQLASDTDIDQLNEILTWIMDEYAKRRQVEEDEGKNSKKTDQK